MQQSHPFEYPENSESDVFAEAHGTDEQCLKISSRIHH